MSDRMHRILESKRALRTRLATLPIPLKLAMIEKLRARTLAIRAARAAGPMRSRP